MIAKQLVGSGVLILTIDHPPANALTASDITALATIVEDLSSQDDAPAIVLTGSGSRFFCPGGDIKELDAASLDVALERMRGFHRLLTGLECYPRPLCVAVNGYAVGGGMELLLFADAVLAVPDATFGFPEINHGVLPAVKGIRQAARRLGHKAAAQMLYSGELVSCDVAKGLGLVDAVVPPGELLATAVGHAESLASKPPLLFGALKRAIHRTEAFDDEELEQATLDDMKSYLNSGPALAARARWRS